MTAEKIFHLDLFSGIGGFSLASDSVWDNVEHIFCDNDPFCQAILKKHWPNSKIYGDIRTITNSDLNGLQEPGTQQQATRNRQPYENTRKIDLLTGGFPCQPFSSAGKRRGTEDDRHLWPEMFRVIRETKPTWTIAENVSGLLTWDNGLVFEQVCADLEGEGYEVQPLVIPAVSLNAPHRRDRVWIIGHSQHDGFDGSKDRESGNQRSNGDAPWKNQDEQFEGSDVSRGIAAYPAGIGDEGGRSEERGIQEREFQQEERQGDTLRSKAEGSPVNDPNATGEGREGGRDNAQGQHGQPDSVGGYQRIPWSEDWTTVAAEFCTLYDGLPNGLSRPKGWRNAALKGAGNAIVPQIAIEIMKSIKLSI